MTVNIFSERPVTPPQRPPTRRSYVVGNRIQPDNQFEFNTFNTIYGIFTIKVYRTMLSDHTIYELCKPMGRPYTFVIQADDPDYNFILALWHSDCIPGFHGQTIVNTIWYHLCPNRRPLLLAALDLNLNDDEPLIYRDPAYRVAQNIRLNTIFDQSQSE